jgi:hypothetical protein
MRCSMVALSSHLAVGRSQKSCQKREKESLERGEMTPNLIDAFDKARHRVFIYKLR